ncbi:MAG: hypothetical protein ACI4R8_04175 [Candidatus Caccovivens sp.]
MLLGAIICMAVACIILSGTLCFVTKHKTLCFLLQTCLYIAIICLGFVCANYENNFSGYSILIILSVIPLFLSLFDLEAYLTEKRTNFANKQDFTQNENEENENQAKILDETKKEKKNYFLNSNGALLKSISFLLPAICIGFAGLYLGIETIFGFLLGLALAFAGIFLLLIIKKHLNPYDLLGYFLSFLAIGVCLGQIVTVILYAQTITNILYCVGSFIFCSFVALSTFKNTKYNHLLYILAIFSLFLTIIL